MSSNNGLTTPLQRFTSLLGENAYLVPFEWGTKKPLVTYVERPFAGTKTPAYQALFEMEQTNIAVYLGNASNGLCAVDFDDDGDLAKFMVVNPRLAYTTRSRGSRGGMVWVQVEGDYPESCNPEHKHFEWRADKRLSTIYGRHPQGMDYKLVVDATPLVVNFADIIWPPEWELPWVSALADQAAAALVLAYGEPFYTNKSGVCGINERYWAGLYAREIRVLYDPDEKEFYRYIEKRGLWQPITKESIRETISQRLLDASRESDSSLEKQIKVPKVNSVVGALMGLAEKCAPFQLKQRAIHVANGVIQFSDDGDVQFGAFSPEFYSRNQSPYSFDQNAQCPRFLNELVYPAVSEEDAGLLQRWFGLALFGYNLPQRFLILDGMPNGGKGTLVRIIQALVGPENTYQLRTECLSERFETFRYRRKTLLIGPDVSGDFLMRKGASMLKVLVGGDPISAEGKGLNGDFAMFGTFNVVMTCNSHLRVRLDGDAGAWRRRLLVIRFENPPPSKRLLDFHRELLRDEGSGILRWALAGFVQLQAEFTRRGDFNLSEAQQGRIDSLLAESDSLRLFAQERIERHDYGDITTNEFQQAYAEYCADKGWNPMPITVIGRIAADVMLEVWRVAQNHCVERDGRKSNRGWKKVRIKG